MQNSLQLLFMIFVTAATPGCMSVRYYAQAVRGQYQILAHRQPIDKLIANPDTSPKLRQQLQLVQQLRAFAKDELQLPVDGSYNKYVDVHRKYVVWDVQAAPQFSLEPKTWWYPFVGRLAYRGYFSEKSARDYGDRLAKKGFDVYVDGVDAYSTLGWFKDPLLNTFIDDSEAELADVLFHELGHKRVFASGDTDFNEAFATTVGQEGVHRWLRSKGDQKLRDDYDAALARDRQFVGLIMMTREKLGKVYAGTVPASLSSQKQMTYEELRQQYSDMKAKWGAYSGYDDWFAHDLNNAKLNTIANYNDFVPGFQRLLEMNGGNLEKFYAAAQHLAKTPEAARHQKLRDLAAGA